MNLNFLTRVRQIPPLPVIEGALRNLHKYFFGVKHSPPKTKLTPRPRRHIKRDLSSLLDNVEVAFKNVTYRRLGGSFTHPDTIAGLKNLGPHIPVETESEWNADWCSKRRSVDDHTWPSVNITDATKFSSLMFMAMDAGVDYDDRHNHEETPYEKWHPEMKDALKVGEWRVYREVFLYATRVNRLPWNCAPINGDVFYECGAAWREIKKRRLYWIGYFIGMTKETGVVQCSKMLMDEHVQPGRTRGDGSPLSIAKGHRSPGFNRKYWAVPYKDSFDPLQKHNDEFAASINADQFTDLFNFWQRRGSYWQVGIRRGKRRVTFCVRPEETKDYFKNRDKTAITKGGKRRPIIHFVNEHERRLSHGRVTTVKAHIRGLRLFYWNGFHCSVVAPKWHKLNALSFDVASINKDDFPTDEKGIPISVLGSRLADMEDYQRKEQK